MERHRGMGKGDGCPPCTRPNHGVCTRNASVRDCVANGALAQQQAVAPHTLSRNQWKGKWHDTGGEQRAGPILSPCTHAARCGVFALVSGRPLAPHARSARASRHTRASRNTRASRTRRSTSHTGQGTEDKAGRPLPHARTRSVPRELCRPRSARPARSSWRRATMHALPTHARTRMRERIALRDGRGGQGLARHKEGPLQPWRVSTHADLRCRAALPRDLLCRAACAAARGGE